MKTIALVLLALLSVSAGAATQVNRQETQAYAVQQRPQQMQKELFLHLSYLPSDHFTHYFAGGGGYTHYFNSYFGWEVVHANWANALSTNLETELRTRYHALPEAFDVIRYWATTNLVYTPFYTKNLFLGKEVIWGDISLIGGYGLATLKNTGNVNVVDLGAALRFYANNNWAYKLDLRQYFYFTTAVKPNFGITAAIAYNFGSFEEKKSEANP